MDDLSLVKKAYFFLVVLSVFPLPVSRCFCWCPDPFLSFPSVGSGVGAHGASEVAVLRGISGSVQYPCWLMIIGDYTNQYIGIIWLIPIYMG